MKRRVQLFVVSVFMIILAGCGKNTSKNVIGSYSSYKPNKVERLWYGLNGFHRAVGSELVLQADSSFKLVTCANISTGVWVVDGDSLLMFAKTNRWRNDSLHIHGFEGRQPTISTRPSAYLIKNDMLKKKVSWTDTNGQTKKTLFYLEKN